MVCAWGCNWHANGIGKESREDSVYTDLFQVSLHNLGPVVDSQHHISDTSLGKSLNLVLDHRLIGKLDKGFGKSQGLRHAHRWLAPLYSFVHRPTRGVARQGTGVYWESYKRSQTGAEATHENKG